MLSLAERHSPLFEKRRGGGGWSRPPSTPCASRSKPRKPEPMLSMAARLMAVSAAASVAANRAYAVAASAAAGGAGHGFAGGVGAPPMTSPHLRRLG